MFVWNLKIQPGFVSPQQILFDFFNLNTHIIPVVEDQKPVGYLSLRRLFREIIPVELITYSDAISKNAGSLNMTWNDMIGKLQDKKVSEFFTKDQTTIEKDDRIIKAACQILKYDFSIISVIDNGKYIGYVSLESIAQHFFEHGLKYYGRPGS